MAFSIDIWYMLTFAVIAIYPSRMQSAFVGCSTAKAIFILYSSFIVMCDVYRCLRAQSNMRTDVISWKHFACGKWSTDLSTKVYVHEEFVEKGETQKEKSELGWQHAMELRRDEPAVYSVLSMVLFNYERFRLCFLSTKQKGLCQQWVFALLTNNGLLQRGLFYFLLCQYPLYSLIVSTQFRS